jgi:hypothetical protein
MTTARIVNTYALEEITTSVFTVHAQKREWLLLDYLDLEDGNRKILRDFGNYLPDRVVFQKCKSSSMLLVTSNLASKKQ